ncbi:hypothetical protein FisN_16Lh279 [Fistulifera solaris]|uniref:Uncharacterized protein n=1 Tax=Fistulifera solaris TaxID=1519565 RepID=A0A1Z5KQ00_FISSO|nr:hypothetical protein FisN_16Lh279 [Fistulifera solaris]|eukprot:GAX28018.1 hypothetical protein FisN_16Lh279 [Fistulifera solaris]
MSEAQNSGTQQQSWGAPGNNDSPMFFQHPPPPGMPANVRPPIRPPMENTHFTAPPPPPPPPPPAHHNITLQYQHDLGWGVPTTKTLSVALPTSQQNTWAAMSNASSPWPQPTFTPTYPPGIARGFTNLPPPPPPLKPPTPMNSFHLGVPVSHWPSVPVALPTNANIHGNQQFPNLGAMSAGPYSTSHQGAPFVTQSSHSYTTAPAPQHLLESNSVPQIPPPPPPSHKTVTPSEYVIPNAPSAPSQVQTGAASAPSLQEQQEGSRTARNRRKRKRQQERKNCKDATEGTTEEATVPETANEAGSSASQTSGQFSDPVDDELDQEMAVLEYLIQRYESALSKGMPEEALFRDLEISCEKIREVEQRGNYTLPNLEVVEKRTRLMRRAQDIVMSRSKEYTILPEITKQPNANAQSEATWSSVTTTKDSSFAGHWLKESLPNHSVATDSAMSSDNTQRPKASLPNDSVTSGPALSSPTVEFAVENDLQETIVPASVPKKSVSKALEEAKAKLRLAKLQMTLAAKKKALQEAKTKSGQSPDPINALLKGGLDCLLFERITSSGPPGKVRFVDTVLEDDPAVETGEKHSSDMSMDDDSSDDVRLRPDDPPLEPAGENLPLLCHEPSLLQRITELQNLTLSKLKNFESGPKLQRLDKAGLTSLLRDTVDKTMEDLNDGANLEMTSSLGSSKESKASTRALLKKRKEEALRSRAVAHHKNVISKQQRLLRKQLMENEQIDQSIRDIDEEVLLLSNQQCPDLRAKIRTLEGRKQVLDDMLAGYLAELMSLRKELHANKQQTQEGTSWVLSPS